MEQYVAPVVEVVRAEELVESLGSHAATAVTDGGGGGGMAGFDGIVTG